MDNNTRLENIFNKTLEVAEGIVNTTLFGSSMEGVSALEGLMNVAKIANDLKSSLGTAVNFDMSGALPAPDFGGHGMRL